MLGYRLTKKGSALATRASVIIVVFLIIAGVGNIGGYGAGSKSQGSGPTQVTADKNASSVGGSPSESPARLSSAPAILSASPAGASLASCNGPCTQNGIWAGWLFCGQTLNTWTDTFGVTHYFCDYNSNQANPSATFSGVQASWNLPNVVPTPAPSGSDQCTAGAPSGGYEYLYQWVGLGGDGDASSIASSPLVQAGISETVACTGSSLNVSFEPWFEAVSEDPTPNACPSNSASSSGTSTGSPDAIKAGMKVTVSVQVTQNDTVKQTFEVKYEIDVQAGNGTSAFTCNEKEQVHLVFLGNSIEMELEVPSGGLIAGSSGLSGGSTDPAWGCQSSSNGFSLTPAFSEMNVTNFQYEGGPPSPNSVFIPGFPSVTNNQMLDMNGCDPVTGSVTQIPSPLLGSYFTEDYGASRYMNSYGYPCYGTQCYSYTGYFPGTPVFLNAGQSTLVDYLLGTGYIPGFFGASPVPATTTNLALVISFVGSSEPYTTTTTAAGTNNCNDTFAPVPPQYLSQGGGFGPPDLSVMAKVCTPATPGYVTYGVGFQLWYAPSATQGGLGCSYSSCLELWDTGVLSGPSLRVYSSASATFVVCTPALTVTGTQTKCKATVTGSSPSSPTGTVSWSAGAKGTFSTAFCTLLSGSCTVSFTPTFTPAVPYSTVTISATYGGDANNAGSSGSSSLSVTTKQASSTSLKCTEASIGTNVTGTCVATVSENCALFLGNCMATPTGIVDMSSSAKGKFIPGYRDCFLKPEPFWLMPVSESCSEDFTLSPAPGIPFTITGHYLGDYLYNQSSDTVSLNAAPKPASYASVSCTPSSVVAMAGATCTVTVTGSSPTGNVTWSTTGIWDFSAGSCILSSGSCSVGYTPTVPASPVNITAIYWGDSNNGGSSGTFSLLVTSLTTTTTTSSTATGSSSKSQTVSSGSVTSPTGASTTGSATSIAPQPGGSSTTSVILSFVAGVLAASLVFALLIRRRTEAKKG